MAGLRGRFKGSSEVYGGVQEGKDAVDVILLPKKEPKKNLPWLFPKCGEEGCTEASKAGGLCWNHWEQKQNECIVVSNGSLVDAKVSNSSLVDANGGTYLEDEREVEDVEQERSHDYMKKGTNEEKNCILSQVLAKANAQRESEYSSPSHVLYHMLPRAPERIFYSPQDEECEGDKKSISRYIYSDTQHNALAVAAATATDDAAAAIAAGGRYVPQGRSSISTSSALNYDDQDIVNILGEMKSNNADELEPESERMPVPEPSDDGMPKRETRGMNGMTRVVWKGPVARGPRVKQQSLKDRENAMSSSSSSSSSCINPTAAAYTTPIFALDSLQNKRMCSVEGCTVAAHRGGLCSMHGGYIKCSVGGCNKQTVVGGLCWVHGGDPRRKCNVLGCNTIVNRGGLCAKHGESPRCNIAGCEKQAISAGLCWTHGGGSGKQCSIQGCTTLAQKGGLCCKHGGNSKKPCNVEGCNTRANLWGLCGKHGGYRRCSVEGCDKAAKAGGLCMAHGGGAAWYKAGKKR